MYRANFAFDKSSLVDVAGRDLDIRRLDVERGGGAARRDRTDRRAAGSTEWIQHGVASEREHENQSLSELGRVRRRMATLGRRPAHIGPNRPPPALHLLLREHG